MEEAGVIGQTALVFGQMDEPPGTRLRVALSALTMAEYFRDVQNQDVLLFIDNIFRFTQAGSEVSTLLGRMPSAVGYQPNLADEMGTLQERITSTRGHSITSMQAIYVPADDYTDPAPATTFAHLDATTELSREIASLGIYPAVDPLTSTSRILDAAVHRPGPLRLRDPDQADPAAQQGAAGHHRDPRCRRAVRGGQDHRLPGAPHPAVPVAEHLRRQAVHRPRGLDGPGRRRPSRRSTRSPTASTTTSPSRRSSCAAVWTTSSGSGTRSRRASDDGRRRCRSTLVAADREVWSGEATVVNARTLAGEIGIMAEPHAGAVGARAGPGRRPHGRRRPLGGRRRRRLHLGGRQPGSMLCEHAELSHESDFDEAKRLLEERKAALEGETASRAAGRPSRAPTVGPRQGEVRCRSGSGCSDVRRRSCSLLVLLYGVCPGRPPPVALPPRRHLRAQLPRPVRQGRARLVLGLGRYTGDPSSGSGSSRSRRGPRSRPPLRAELRRAARPRGRRGVLAVLRPRRGDLPDPRGAARAGDEPRRADRLPGLARGGPAAVAGSSR